MAIPIENSPGSPVSRDSTITSPRSTYPTPYGTKPADGARYGALGSNTCTVQVHNVPWSASSTGARSVPAHRAHPDAAGNVTAPHETQHAPASRGGSSELNRPGSTAITPTPHPSGAGSAAP